MDEQTTYTEPESTEPETANEATDVDEDAPQAPETTSDDDGADQL